MPKLIIFDVDGTLTSTKSGATFRKSADDWQWLPGRLAKLQELDRQGVKLAIATNQGGVAFGYLGALEIRHELMKMSKEGHITWVEMCFSHPKATIAAYQEDSPRRKPGAGMLLAILEASGEKPEDTLMVGDREEDEQAAKNAGVAFRWSRDFFGDKED